MSIGQRLLCTMSPSGQNEALGFVLPLSLQLLKALIKLWRFFKGV